MDSDIDARPKFPCKKNFKTVILPYHKQNNKTLIMEEPYNGITCSPLPQNNGNFHLPFFGGSYPIFLLDNIY